MKVLSLFDGISCARVALERVGINVESYYASEIDKYAIQISQKNYPDIIHLGNVVDIKYDTFDKCLDVNNYLYNADIDLLIGGSPCQDLSIAKAGRKGLDGEKSGLFYEYVRILNEVKPKYFILENVASMSKESKDKISEILGVEPVMINASLVSAQNRKRLFWVGKLVGDKYEKVNIELPEDRGILLIDILEEEVDEKYVITSERKNTLISNRPQNPNQKKAKTLLVGGTNPTIYQWRRSYWREMSEQNKCPTLTSAMGIGGGNVPILDKYRKLTPIECERLQGLPDNYTDGISNTQRYKTLGNAFNVDVVAHILKYLTK